MVPMSAFCKRLCERFRARVRGADHDTGRRRPVALGLLAALLAGGLAVLPGLSPPAEAHVHVSVGFGAFFGPPAFYGYGYGYPAYSYPYAYYAPPPVYYAPPPVYYAPPAYVEPTYAAPVTVQAPECRTYHGDATIDASGRPFYGTACLGTDGRWHIVH